MQQCHEDISESSENRFRTATVQHSQCRNQTNQCHSPHGYGYPPSQQSFPGTPQFYPHSPLNMSHSTLPTTSTCQGYPSNGPQWQEYDLQHGGYGGFQMFPPPQIPLQGPASPGVPRVSPGLPEHHPVIQLSSSNPNPHLNLRLVHLRDPQ